jgi:hypothetical protein
MKLTSTSDKVQVVTTTAANTDVYATWGDYDPAVSPATDRVTFGRLISKISSATTTDVVPVPGSGDTRKVHIINVSNVHASTSQTVTIQITDGANTAVIDSFPLAAGERATWREGVPLRIIDANGLEKTTPIAVGQYTVSRLGATVSNSTTTAAKVTGLDLACGPGTWVFEYFLRFQSATGTVGPKLSVNHSGTVTTFLQTLTVPTTAATDSSGVFDQVATAPVVLGAMALRAKDATASMIGTAGVDTTAADILIQISGLAIVTVGGNMELYHASETATSTSIMLDSALRLTKMA